MKTQEDRFEALPNKLKIIIRLREEKVRLQLKLQLNNNAMEI